MTAYYNEIDAYAAQWLRNLIAAGLIAPGEVDERSIADVRPDDLAGYNQCHFFAGIGGWSYALRLARWLDDRPVWTGSCPCQPFSVAGKQAGFDDSRHLWPHWRELIAQCRPTVVFGEQVANAPQWVRLVRGDLEALAYAVGCIPIEAASAGAYHFRDRYWFVADRDGKRHEVALGEPSDTGSERAPVAGNGVCHVADSQGGGRGRRGTGGACVHEAPQSEGHDSGELADPAGDGWGEGWTESELRGWRPATAVCSIDGCQIIECPDGKWRRLPPPRVRWLGTRLPARISRVRAFGNAIDPRPASSFIAAFMDSATERPAA